MTHRAPPERAPPTRPGPGVLAILAGLLVLTAAADGLLGSARLAPFLLVPVGVGLLAVGLRAARTAPLSPGASPGAAPSDPGPGPPLDLWDGAPDPHILLTAAGGLARRNAAAGRLPGLDALGPTLAHRVFREGIAEGEVAAGDRTLAFIVTRLPGELAHVALRDITRTKAETTEELHRAEDAQRSTQQSLVGSESRYRALVEQNPIGLFENVGGEIAFANRAFLELVGARDPSEVVGQPALDRFHPDDHPAIRRRIAEISARGGPLPWLDLRLRRVDGSYLEVETSSSAVTDGGRHGIQVMVRDVSRERLLERQLRQAQKMEALGALAGGVAHDFNNALTVISGFAEMLFLELPAGDARREHAQEIFRAAGRATTLTRQLLAFSRRQEAEPRRLDINAVLAESAKLLGKLVGPRVTLEVRPGTGIPPVFLDPGHLEQVVFNLAVNARDAMPDGGRFVLATKGVDVAPGDPRLVSRGLEPGRHVLLEVADTGTGMDPATLARVFEPFFTTRGDQGGTGLGLATVYGIVRQARGGIAVESTPGKGTTFRIYLPAASEEAEAPGAAQPFRLPSGVETILLVEDDDRVRAVSRVALTAQGYEVLEARNGEEALALAGDLTRPIHLLLSDVVMPGLSGRQVAEAVWRLRPGLPTLFVSGYTDEARAGPATGGPPLLRKPYSLALLTTTVRKLLDA